MINLKNSTTDKLQLNLSAAITVDVHASWVDLSGTTVTPDRTNTNISGAGDTDIVATPGASTTRNVKTLNIRNRHASSSVDVIVKYNANGTVSELHKVTLLAGQALVYVEGFPWVVIPAFSSVVDANRNDFRLTGVTATPVMIADSTTLSTIFLTPYKGNGISLYSGGAWHVRSSGEVSLAVTGRTTDLPFDIFAYDNAGVVTLEFLDWTNATTRATGLTRQDGVWTKTGDATRRYLGSCRARSATTFHHRLAGDDVPVRIDLWNADNRVEHAFTLRALTNTWTYTTATWRPAGLPRPGRHRPDSRPGCPRRAAAAGRFVPARLRGRPDAGPADR